MALATRSDTLFEALRTDATPTLRWYRPDAAAIVLGRGQHGALAGTSALPVVTRPSGGGAVLLGPDLLSLDVLLPSGHPLLGDRLTDVFLAVGRAWTSALHAAGVPGLRVHEGPGTARRTGSPRERLLAAVCFATVGRGEVLADGRKLVGLSQRRRRWGALVQCGLLRRWHPAALLAALGVPADDPDILRRAVGLDELVATPPSDAALTGALEGVLGGYSLRH